MARPKLVEAEKKLDPDAREEEEEGRASAREAVNQGLRVHSNIGALGGNNTGSSTKRHA